MRTSKYIRERPRAHLQVCTRGVDANPAPITGRSMNRVNGASPISSILYSETVGSDESGLHLMYVLRARGAYLNMDRQLTPWKSSKFGHQL
jgi:hypothetical protein